MRKLFFLPFVLLLPAAAWAMPAGTSRNSAVKPELVSFPAEGRTLLGYLWKPKGPGPFPAVIYSHGSSTKAGNCAPLGHLYTSRGYVFFFPHRHGHGKSPGEPIATMEQHLRARGISGEEFERRQIDLHELYNKDVVAALSWLKQQPYVDSNKIIASGISFGGIQTVLLAEKGLGVRAFIPFAPGAISWNPILGERLSRAVKNATAPIFLIQAQNDYSTHPTEVLGKILNQKEPPNRSKLYPAFGSTHEAGHAGFAKNGADIWGTDVFPFIDRALAAAK